MIDRVHEFWSVRAEKTSDGSDGTTLARLVVIAGSIVIPLIVVGTGGNVMFGALFLALLSVGLVTVYRLDWGFYLWVGLVMASDSYDIPGFQPLINTAQYLTTLNTTYRGMTYGVLAPVELHILFFLFVFFVIAALRKDIHLQKVTLGYAGVLFFGGLVVSLLYGKFRGGDVQMGIWEIRALMFFGLTFFLARQVITTREQITNLFWVFIIAIALKGFEAIMRFGQLGYSFGGFRTVTNHEDPLFGVTLLIFLLGLVYFGYRGTQKKVLWTLLPILAFAFYLGNRRATYASLIVCLIGFLALLASQERKKVMKRLAVFAVLFCLYLAAFWNSYGRAATVARAVRTTIFSDDREISAEDFSSGLARQHENYCLAVTFRRAPLLGIGFGNMHDWPIRAWGAFALKGYITHNEILWLLTKTGAVGFFFFLFFLNLIVLQGASISRQLRDPYLRALCVMMTLAILNQLVVSYVDMQLTYYRNMIYLGILTGMIPTLPIVEKKEQGELAWRRKAFEEC